MGSKNCRLGAITRDNLDRVAEALDGTCDSVKAALSKLEINGDPDIVENQLLNLNVERCPCCGWWMDSMQLIDDDDEVVGCQQCRSNEEEAERE